MELTIFGNRAVRAREEIKALLDLYSPTFIILVSNFRLALLVGITTNARQR